MRSFHSVSALALACLALVSLPTSPARADELQGDSQSIQETIDFSSGILFGETHSEMAAIGAELTLRYHHRRGVYLGGILSTSFLVNDDNPERVQSNFLLGGGMSTGLHAQLGSLQLHSGVRAEYIRSIDASSHGARFVSGARGGPELAAQQLLGRVWGHPLYLEARGVYQFYRTDGQMDASLNGWQAGLFFTGGLWPEPQSLTP